MSKEIRELEENSKRIIENMRPQTIAQYHIKQWLDDNFIWAVQGWSTQERTQQRLWTLLAVSCM